MPARSSGISGKSYGEIHLSDTDISFVSSERPSVDRMFPSLYDHLEKGLVTSSRMSCVSETDHDRIMNQMSYDISSEQFERKSLDVLGSPPDFSPISPESDRLSNTSQSMVRTKYFSSLIHVVNMKKLNVMFNLLNKHIVGFLRRPITTLSRNMATTSYMPS